MGVSLRGNLLPGCFFLGLRLLASPNRFPGILTGAVASILSLHKSFPSGHPCVARTFFSSRLRLRWFLQLFFGPPLRRLPPQTARQLFLSSVPFFFFFPTIKSGFLTCASSSRPALYPLAFLVHPKPWICTALFFFNSVSSAPLLIGQLCPISPALPNFLLFGVDIFR